MTLRQKLSHIVTRAVNVIELMVSYIIVAMVVILIVRMVIDNVFSGRIFNMTTEEFSVLLGQALTLVVGLEFVRLLITMKATDLIEVVMFATARQLVVEHMPMSSMIIGAAVIAMLFAVRKYLLGRENISNEENEL